MSFTYFRNCCWRGNSLWGRRKETEECWVWEAIQSFLLQLWHICLFFHKHLRRPLFGRITLPKRNHWKAECPNTCTEIPRSSTCLRQTSVEKLFTFSRPLWPNKISERIKIPLENVFFLFLELHSLESYCFTVCHDLLLLSILFCCAVRFVWKYICSYFS